MGVRAASIAGVALALAACGGGNSASISPPPASAASTQTAPASVASASASPMAGGGCRLPVFNWGPVTNGSSTSIAGKNGFLSLPAGTFSADPAGVMLYDETTFVTSTQRTPTLEGDSSSGTYDAPRGRWLPVARSNVLPDGSAYVYELELRDGSGYDIHFVDVVMATDTVIYHMPYDNGYQVLGFEPGSVYVYPILHRSGVPAGLWRLDIANLTLNPVPNSMDMTWGLVASGVAWGGPGGAAGHSLYSLDLKSGTLTKWFQHPVQGAVFEGYGYGVSLFAFDRSGHPLVQVYPPPPGATSSQTPPVTPEVWVVNAPGHATQLSGLAIPENGLTAGVTDALGTWIVGGDGVYLYTEAGFQRMAGLPPEPTPNYTLDGPCA
jgi:hypothetical protein